MDSLPTVDELIAEFADLADGLERAEYLEDLGRSPLPFPEEERTETNRVLGCMSQVWLIARPSAASPGRLEFLADSNSSLVRGLVVVLLAAMSGKTPPEILQFPIVELFDQLGIRRFLAQNRTNGLFSMIKRIRDLAAQRLGQERAAELGTSVSVRPADAPSTATTAAPLDVAAIRADFPILKTRLSTGQPLVYLDNGATTQLPRQVIDAMREAQESYYSNVHRSAHELARRTLEKFEGTRASLRALLNAKSSSEILFTSGTTAALNLVARSWGDANLKPGDEILLTVLEHHSNIVPWQQLAARTGAVVRWIPVTDGFELDLAALDELLTPRTKLVAVAAVSNVLGTINPIPELVRRAHAVGAVIVVDAAQSVPHQPLDVQAWDADFVAFSGHKMLGPSGVGVLYGKEKLLQAMPPFLGGGSMIHTVTLAGFTPAELPYKFEAGTPMIVPVIGLGAAIDYLNRVGLARIHAHEQALTRRAHDQLVQIPGLPILGPAPEKKGGLVSFTLERCDPNTISDRLDLAGIAIRAGHHCAMPLHTRFRLAGSARASFYLYNTLEEVDLFAAALRKLA